MFFNLGQGPLVLRLTECIPNLGIPDLWETEVKPIFGSLHTGFPVLQSHTFMGMVDTLRWALTETRPGESFINCQACHRCDAALEGVPKH